jgi:hypothetical protein
MKKLFYALTVLVLIGGSLSVAAAAATTDGEPAAPAEEAGISGPVAQSSISGSAGGAQEAGIFCAITCDDGTGLAYICKLGNFPDCCQIGEDACWSYHGGVDEGTCWQGSVSHTCDGI